MVVKAIHLESLPIFFLLFSPFRKCSKNNFTVYYYVNLLKKATADDAYRKAVFQMKMRKNIKSECKRVCLENKH